MIPCCTESSFEMGHQTGAKRIVDMDQKHGLSCAVFPRQTNPFIGLLVDQWCPINMRAFRHSCCCVSSPLFTFRNIEEKRFANRVDRKSLPTFTHNWTPEQNREKKAKNPQAKRTVVM